jgi:hypothetical protein
MPVCQKLGWDRTNVVMRKDMGNSKNPGFVLFDNQNIKAATNDHSRLNVVSLRDLHEHLVDNYLYGANKRTLVGMKITCLQ